MWEWGNYLPLAGSNPTAQVKIAKPITRRIVPPMSIGPNQRENASAEGRNLRTGVMRVERGVGTILWLMPDYVHEENQGRMVSRNSVVIKFAAWW